MLTKIPNLLTIFRIIAVPLVVILFYMGGETAIWWALIIFGLAGVTDFFDGYLARKLNQTSALGKFLDPIADKLIVIVTLVMVIAFDHLQGFWVLSAVVIIIREVMVSGLREFLGPYNVQIPVSKLAKWKTVIQMFAIGFVIAGEYGPPVLTYSIEIGNYGLVFAAIVTVITGWDYMKAGYKTVQDLDS